jgi:uncharacterized protein
MPHICTRCKTHLEAAPGLAPRCPTCGGTRFVFESPRKAEAVAIVPEPITEKEHGEIFPDGESIDLPPKKPTTSNEPEDLLTTESIESIRIMEPGKYDLNLVKLAESDDRVIQIGKDGNYRLDLHSMIRTQKKR